MNNLIKLILTKTIIISTSIFGTANKIRLKRLICLALDLLHISNEEITLKNGQRLKFHCPNDLTRWRVQTFFIKEPETLEWIDSFSADETFWDIGANMGIYSLYAAAKGAKVLAFEPSGANFYTLNMSILESNLSNKVTAYCLAFAEQESANQLMMHDYEFGGALSSFGKAIGFDGEEFIPSVKQGMLGFSIDTYMSTFNPPFPNHIKIDVDGIEDKIIKGAEKTLLDSRLRSLSVELDEERVEYTNLVIKKITDSGFILKSKRHSEMFDDSPHGRNFNYQFIRTQRGK